MPLFILSYIMTFVVFYLGFHVLSYFHTKKMITSIENNNMASSQRKRLDYNSDNFDISSILNFLSDNEFMVLKCNNNKSYVLFTKNKFFEREAFIYKLEYNAETEQLHFSVYHNRFHFYNINWFSSKTNNIDLIESELSIAYNK